MGAISGPEGQVHTASDQGLAIAQVRDEFVSHQPPIEIVRAIDITSENDRHLGRSLASIRETQPPIAGRNREAGGRLLSLSQPPLQKPFCM